MSFPSLTASFPPPNAAARPGEHLAQQLASLVDEIQRTRDWFNAQIETQLNSLRQLRAAMQPDEPTYSASMATLFQAPQAAPAAPSAPALALPAPASPTALTPPDTEVPTPPVNGNGVKHEHEAIVLPPTHITALDPELEQATLRELNDALSRAFSEISARGGMLS